jgi:uncharacterized membrane protein YbhN (UPF0104 family)
MVEAGAVMLVGCVVTVVLAATIIPPESLPTWVAETVPRESASWGSLLIAVVILVLAMPIVAIPANWILVRIARIVEKRAQLKAADEKSAISETSNDRKSSDHELTDSTIGKLTWQFLVAASLMFALSWAGHGLSLLLVLRSMDPEILTVDAWIISIAAAAAGTSIGFFAVFAPGGLAVREGLIITMLAPSLGGPIAVAGAGLYRLASLIAEAAAALILYLVVPKNKEPSKDLLS